MFQKLYLRRNNNPFPGFGGAGIVTRLRGRLNTVDPWNLNQIILAEGKKAKQQIRPNRRNTFSTMTLAEIIVMVALAGALSLVSHSFFSLPQGGSINIGMIPIFWLALRRGPKIGIFAGAVFGVVDLAIEPFVVHPVQFILDYPLAFAALGLAGLFKRWRVFGPVVGVVVGGTGRFLSHFVSGIVYFASYAPPGQSPAVYSLIYNGAYMFPSIVICAVVIFSLQASKSLDIYM
jgi:thiamine transporter